MKIKFTIQLEAHELEDTAKAVQIIMQGTAPYSDEKFAYRIEEGIITYGNIELTSQEYSNIVDNVEAALSMRTGESIFRSEEI